MAESSTFGHAVDESMKKFREEMSKHGWYVHGGYGRGNTEQVGNIKLTNHNASKGRSRYTGFSFMWKEYWEHLDGTEAGTL